MKPEQEYLRQIIREWMSLLAKILGHYEQTTHGSLATTNLSFTFVTDALAKCYEDPTAFNISELSQCIKRFTEYHR